MRRKQIIASAVALWIGSRSYAGTGAPEAAAQPAAGGGKGLPNQIINNDTPERIGQLMQQTGGSLLRASMMVKADPTQAKLSDVSFFAVPAPEPHTLKRHDLVTIIIAEESEITSTSNKEFKKEADFTAKLDQFIQLDLKKLEIKGLAPAQNPADIDISGTREFKGNGEMDRTDSLTARITAEVVDVKPDGNLVVQARKRIKTDEEEQQFILSGICRAGDVSTDNTILSTQIFDLDLQKNHKGDVKTAITRGWLPRLMDLLNPF
jgi:flagellar L-ring protein precursor FlgH